MLPLVILGKKLGVKLIHNLARIYNSAAVARFKGNGNTINIWHNMLKNRLWYIDDLFDLFIGVAIELFRVMLFTLAVDKVVEVDIKEYILVVSLEQKFLKPIKITELKNAVIISIPVFNGALLIVRGILKQYNISN